MYQQGNSRKLSKELLMEENEMKLLFSQAEAGKGHR